MARFRRPNPRQSPSRRWTFAALSDTSARSRLRAGLSPALCFARIPIRSIERGCRVQVLVRDNNVDQALKALKKKMQREGIFREMKLRGHYEKPSEKKAREKAEAVRRARKLARKKLQREGLLPMKPKPVFGAGPGAERGGAAAGAVPVRGRAARADRNLRYESDDAGLGARVFVLQCLFALGVFDQCNLRRGRVPIALTRASIPHLWHFRFSIAPVRGFAPWLPALRCALALAIDALAAVRSIWDRCRPRPTRRRLPGPLQPPATWRRPRPRHGARPGAGSIRQDRRGPCRVRSGDRDSIPNNAQALYGRGLLYQGEKQHQSAIDDFTSANGLRPQLAEPLLGRAASYLALDKIKEAAADLDEAAQAEPKNAQKSGRPAGSPMNGSVTRPRRPSSYGRAISIRPKDEASRSGFARVGGKSGD